MSSTDLNRALVVDDDRDVLQFFAATLESLDVTADCVSSARKFKQAYSECPYQLLILDVVMPEEDGFQLLDWLCAAKCTTPVAFTSAFSQYLQPISQYAKARNMNVAGVWRKPIQSADVAQMIKAMAS